MDSDKKICPYCGEEIMAAAKKCKHCGEWLNMENISHLQHSSTPQKSIIEQPKINVSNAIVYILMVLAAVISAFNLSYESYNLEIAYEIPTGITLSLAWLIVLTTVIFTIISVSKGKAILQSLRSWIALEVFSLCAPILMLSYINGSDSSPIMIIMCLTAFLGVAVFFLTKYLSGKIIANLYTFGSILYVLLSVIIFLIFKES